MKNSLLLKLIYFCSFTFYYTIVNGQNDKIDTSQIPIWIDMMANPNVNFYQTQRAFNLYWQNREIKRGSGYKPFKRWEYSVKNFVDKNGKIIPFQVQKDIYKNWKEKNKIQSDKRSLGPCPNGFWKEIGPNSEIELGNNEGLGRINAVAFHPTDSNIIYCGAPAGGLWRSINRGEFWTPLTDNLPTLGVSSIVIDPKNANIIYIGTGDRDSRDAGDKGVFKSIDNGKTFNSMSNGMGDKLISKLIIDPNNSNVLIAATNRGIYKTNNAGLNWTATNGSWEFKDIDYMPGNFKNIYATEGGNFYLSQDSGNSFVKINLNIKIPSFGGVRSAIGVSNANPNIVYFIITSGGSFYAMLMSIDGGKTFNQKSNTPNIMGFDIEGKDFSGQAWYNLDIAVNPLNAADVFVGGIHIFRSIDSGKTWKNDLYGNSQSVIHVDQHVLEFNALTNTLFVGNDGGVYERKLSKDIYTFISEGLGIGQIYRVSVGNKPNAILSGLQDNGSKMYLGKHSFEYVFTGDGMDNTFDKTNTDNYFVSVQNGEIYRKYKNGIGPITNSIESGGWVSPFILKEGDNSTMIAGFRSLFISKNIDTPIITDIIWKQITFASNNGRYIYKIENSPANNNILYYSDDTKDFYKTTDIKSSFPTWQNMTNLLPSTGVVEAIECDYTNAGTVYIAQGTKIFKSLNGGKNWTDISNGLPNVNIYCIVVDSSKTNESIYIGTYAGVYYKNNTMNTWVPFNNNLPEAVWVTDIEISYTGKPATYKLVAGTYGRGVWESTLYNITTKKPIANFEPERTAICKNETLKMIESSMYKGDLNWKILNSDGAEFINSSNNKSIVPYIKFTKTGKYYIQLFVSNCNGTDSITKRIIVYDELIPASCNIKATNRVFGVGYGIRRFYLHNLFNASGDTYSSGPNEDFTCKELQELNRDSTYELAIVSYNLLGEYCNVYADFNNDGDLTDPGELIFKSTKKDLHQSTFKIPKHTVTNTKLRLRVIVNSDSITEPCMVTKKGQSEDYAIIIKVENEILNQDSSTCINTPTKFSEKSIETYNKYLWDFGNGASPSTANTKGPHTVSYNKIGKKTIKLILNDTLTISKIDYINIVTQPKVNFNYSKIGNLIYSFSPYTTTYEKYLWTFGDNIGSSTNINPTYKFTTSGYYSVKLKTGNTQCPDSITKSIYTTNLNDILENDTKISISPNPNRGIFKIKINQTDYQKIFYSIEDYQGKVIINNAELIKSYGNEYDIDLTKNNLVTGIYFIKINTLKENFRIKILIEN